MRQLLLLSVLAWGGLGFGVTLGQAAHKRSTASPSANATLQPKVIQSPTKAVFNGSGPRYATGPSLMGRNAVAVTDRGIFGIGPGRYPWKLGIVTTVFWIGERPSSNNPVPNNRSAWDRAWAANYGGYDNPDPGARRNYIPIRFVPRQNPFYVALPYNDVEGSRTKPEAPAVIPWFKGAFLRAGQTTLKDRWIVVRHGGRFCYAQWEDCGPFRTDHWQYVFGNERPRPNLNQGAGLDVSPAVREYLGLANKDVCDWKFVEFREVPTGPWALYGDNNTFVILHRQAGDRVARRARGGESVTH
ncbi:MAG: hypothetical protein JO069_05345 [Verrucomicrobia bacterium]|nr:hypothetical protein [Verrucomicrobiota bacterium]